MPSDVMTPVAEVDESMWLYFACECVDADGDSFARSVVELCRTLGWHVSGRTGSATCGSVELLHAAACVADLSCISDEIVAELDAAHFGGRPILVLHPAGVEPPSAFQRTLAGQERVRVVTFSNANECLVRMRETFADRQWRAMLRETTVIDDA